MSFPPSDKQEVTRARDTEGAGDEDLLNAVADRIVRMGLTAPAVFFLESSKPLSYVGSQALVFFEPFVKTFLNLKSYDRFQVLLEDRENVERLIQRIERLDETAQREDDERKRAERAARGESRGFWARFFSRGGPSAGKGVHGQ